MWAWVADDIFARTVTRDCPIPHKERRRNPFLQAWRPKVSALCTELRSLVKTAERYGLRAEGLAFSRDILRSMPMWYHTHADRAKVRHLASSSKASACLREKHKIATVADFLYTAEMRETTGHIRRQSCTCTACETTKLVHSCEYPDACFERARSFLDTLPPKWDPRAKQPEDWEEVEHQRAVDECATVGESLVPFDRRISVNGNIGEVFRIFTHGEVSRSVPDTQTQETTGECLIIATDGSCLENGQKTARAGAGVYVEDGHTLNRAIRLPGELAQSNQSGEAAATLVATQLAPQE
ncbi:hypothetical protein C8Q80DRAFT_1113870 [Daedaleopsis nitida]|nr:hypothetical protein C8Q80DRAFT_1113870 [Daedaleopsis nitida]